MTAQTQILLVIAVLVIGVIAALAYLRMQDRKADRTLLDRNSPLTEPDLDFTSLPSETQEKQEPAAPSRPVFAAPARHSPADATTVTASEAAPSVQVALPTQTAANPKSKVRNKEAGANWSTALQTLRQYRHSDELDTALELCFDFLPRAQAFQQLMLTQRAIIRQQVKNKQDATDNLNMLYNTAVLSTLYADSDSLPETVQTAVFAREALRRMDAEYSLVGYELLKNLKKTDITLLIRRWGEPMAHQHPAKVYQEEWWKLA